MKDKRAKVIEKCIRQVYDSLQSHLPLTHSNSPEGRTFHKKCVKEYVELLALLQKLY